MSTPPEMKDPHVAVHLQQSADVKFYATGQPDGVTDLEKADIFHSPNDARADPAINNCYAVIPKRNVPRLQHIGG